MCFLANVVFIIALNVHSHGYSHNNTTTRSSPMQIESLLSPIGSDKIVYLIRHRRAKALELEQGFPECPNTRSPQVLG